ncbi:MAG: hypothetical protein U0936_05900 [Planctomycetaceae bacterium]
MRRVCCGHGFEIVPSSKWISGSPTLDDISRIKSFLTEKGTFCFPTAGGAGCSLLQERAVTLNLTGYRNIWLRDNIQIAWAHLAVQNDPSIPLRNA